MKVSEALLMQMNKRNIKVADVARGTGIPYTTVDGIIKRGNASTSIINMSKIAAYFDMTIEDLVEIKNTKEPQKKSFTLTDDARLCQWFIRMYGTIRTADGITRCSRCGKAFQPNGTPSHEHDCEISAFQQRVKAEQAEQLARAQNNTITSKCQHINL